MGSKFFTSFFTFACIFGVLSAGCERSTSNSTASSDSFTIDSIAKDELVPAEASAWADSIMSGLTLEQLAGQLVFPAVFSDHSDIALRKVVAYVGDCHIGGVVLLKGTPEAARAIADTLLALSPAPPFVAIDAEWGLAMRLSDTPRYPKNGSISPSAEDSLLFEYGRQVAHECHDVGVNMVLGPVLDIIPEEASIAPGRSFIGARSFGSDPMRVTRMGIAYAKGLEAGGVISVAKHFPGHGASDVDSHRQLPAVDKSISLLKSRDLIPFEKYIAEGLSAVMVGHLYVPAMEVDSIPVSVSHKVLHDLIRKEMRFDGLVITDAMNMAGAGGRSGADAIMAGADIIIAPQDTHLEVDMIVKAVVDGRFPLAQLRDRVKRVLIFKYKVAAACSHEDMFVSDSRRIRNALLSR